MSVRDPEKKSDPYPLGRLGNLALRHWKEHRPKMYADLVRSGNLRKQAFEAQEKTRDELFPLLQKGVNYPTAWESVREKYILLPSEDEQAQGIT